MTSSRSREGREEPIAPDGGWGWVILIGSFLSNFILDGICFSFGIFYLEFLDHFDESKGKTSWIGSVLNGTYMLMGPISGALSKRFGCRSVTIVGSVWATIAFLLSTAAPSINWLIITYGVLGGIGFGLMYLPSILTIGFYFDRKRAFASGLATCGSGLGGFVMAPLCRWLIDVYGWRGAQWIVSGILLNGVVIGAIYRPLTELEMSRYLQAWRRTHPPLPPPQPSTTTYISHIQDQSLTHTYTPESVNPDNPIKAMYIGNKQSDHVQYSSLQHISVRREAYSIPDHHKLFDSWHSLSAYGASMDHCTTADTTQHTQPQEAASTDSIHTSHRRTLAPGTSIFRDILREVRELVDWSLLANPVVDIYGVSCILCMAGFFTPFIYLPVKAVSMGYSANRAALLLSVLGVTNIVGRVVAGWMSDRPWADCLVINNVALIVGGVATALCPLIQNFTLLAVYAAVFGLCIAAFVTLRPIILVDLIGLNKLHSTLGIIVLCQGMTSFVGAPLAGLLYDVTGSFNAAFWVAGVFISLAGVINLPLRLIKRWNQRRKDMTHLKSYEDYNYRTVELQTLGPFN